MTKAQITRTDGFRCAPDGHTVIVIPMGATVHDKVAEWALAANAAAAIFSQIEERKVVAPLETKAKRGRAKKDKS